MRRVWVESIALGGVAGAALLAWIGATGGNVVCGAEGAAFAWRAAHFADAWVGALPLNEADGVAVPVAGLPWVALGALAGRWAAPGVAWAAALASGVGLSAAVLWGLSRHLGAGVLGAALALFVGLAPPVAAAAYAEGGVDLAFTAFVAVALVFLPRKSGWARVLGLAALLACGVCDARAGVIAGLASAVAGGGVWALFGALLCAGTGAVAPAAAGVLDPFDLLTPLLTLRPGAVAPGLAALAATLWAIGDRPLRRAAALAFVFALGPVLSAFGAPLTIGGAAVPLPGVLVAALVPHGSGWGGALVVAATAAALGLARTARPRAALLLVPVAALEVMRTTVAPPVCLSLDTPVAVRALSERAGGVLDLPLAVTANGVVFGAPRAAHALYLYQGLAHGRPGAVALAPLPERSPLLGEPAVVLALDTTVGPGRFLLPPARPGDVLRGLGITEIVVHRALFPPRALALLDPVLFKLYGAPQRDHAGDVDLYRVSTDGAARAPLDETLHPADGPPVSGWLELPAYLAGIAPDVPVGAGRGGATEAAVRPPPLATPGAAGERPSRSGQAPSSSGGTRPRPPRSNKGR